MSKTININAVRLLIDYIDKPIFTKTDVMELILATTIVMLADLNIQSDSQYEVKIHIAKMSRVFYKSPNRLVSIVYPFLIRKDNESIQVFDRNLNLQINSFILSEIQMLLYQLKSGNYIDLFTHIDDIEYTMSNDVWSVFNDLLTYDTGYIRYECDYENQNGRIHPIHHFDVNHSNPSKYKFGYDNHLTIKQFMDILDTNTDCYYITKSN